MRCSTFKIFLFFIIIFLVSSLSKADQVYYEDWSGVYFPKRMYENNNVKLLDFKHFSDNITFYILITTWKDKLVFQSRSKTYPPLRLGYFDSEIRQPNKREQLLIEDKCKVKINLQGNKLFVEMNSTDKCNTRVNISGEYIKYGHYNRNASEPKKINNDLFLGLFNNEDICDKATECKNDSFDLIWSNHPDLKEFVQEAKLRKLNCTESKYVKKFQTYVLACLWNKPVSTENCEQLKDMRGPYATRQQCEDRAKQIIKELPIYYSHVEAKSHRCEELKLSKH